MNKWIQTDDFQYLRKIDEGVYELIEANYCDGKYAISEAEEIVVDEYLDENGKYNDEAISIIGTYYGLKSGNPVRDFEDTVADSETREQYFAEMVYECTSHFYSDYDLVTEDEAEKILKHYTETGEYINLGEE